MSGRGSHRQPKAIGIIDGVTHEETGTRGLMTMKDVMSGTENKDCFDVWPRELELRGFEGPATILNTPRNTL